MKNLNPLLADLIKAFSYDYVFAPNSKNVKLDLEKYKRETSHSFQGVTSSRMEKEIQKSLAAVRRALLEKAHKEAEMLSEENKTLNLTDKEILKRSKVGIESDDYSNCKYLGNGIFEETLF